MKKLRRLALTRIHADSTLRHQHWTASGGWQRRIASAVAQYFILPISLIVISAAIATLGVCLAAGLQAARVNVFHLVIAIISTVIAFSHAGWVLRELTVSRRLAVASTLPDSDSEYLSSRIRSSMAKTLAFLAGSLFLGSGIAFGADLNTFETIQVLLLSLLLWMMVSSLSIIIPAFLPMIIRQEFASSMAGLLMLLFVSAGAVAAFGMARQGTLISAALFSLPTGWPILIIKYSVILKKQEFWWLLAPAGVVTLLAPLSYSRLLFRYRIQEFTYEPGSLAIAEFCSIYDRETVVAANSGRLSQSPSSNTIDWLRNPRQRLIPWFNLAAEDEPSEELTPDKAITRIRKSGLTTRFEWPSAGLIERSAAKILRSEELLTADILSAGRPQWSQGMAKALVPATAAVILVVVISSLIHQKFAIICGHLGLAGVVGVLVGSRWAWLWKSGNGDACAALALLPVDGQHVTRAVMVLGAIRSTLIFPFTLGVVIAVTWGHHGQFNLTDSALLSAKISLIVLAVHQWWFLTGHPCTSSHTIRKIILGIVLAIAAAGSSIIGVCLLLMSSGHETWTTIGAGLLFGTGWLAQRIHHRNVLKLPTDFVLNRPSQMATTHRQQKSRHTERVPTFWPRPAEFRP